MLLAASMTSCGSAPRSAPPIPAPANLVGPQLVRIQPELKGRRFSTLLEFESVDDLAFVSLPPSITPKLQLAHAHTARSSLLFPPGAQKVSVKLGALMSGRPFPGDWMLAGAYVFADAPGEMTVTCRRGSGSGSGSGSSAHTVGLAPGRWTPVFADVDVLSGAASSASGSSTTLEFALNRSGGGSVWLDDVMLIDNAEWLLGGPGEGGSTGTLTVRKRGFRMLIERRGAFAVALDTLEASADGWRVEELSTLRARFSSDGPTKNLTIYRDGRSFSDGRYKPLQSSDADAPAIAAAHVAPALASVPEELGRLDRTSPGDANNDGYNETRGAYELTTSGPRFEATLTPQTVPIIHPILEISGLPPGKVLITVEGQLVSESTRLPDGRLLIELPLRLERATTVNVRVE
jgi:hypothetical protein